MKKRTAFLLFVIVTFFAASAQSINEQLTKKQVSCNDVFTNLSDVLPQLYANRLFDSMRIALTVTHSYCDSNTNVLFYLETLLNIQQSVFSVHDLPKNGKFDSSVSAYLFTLQTLRTGGYSINKYSYYHYSDHEQKLYYFIQFWAQNLLAAKQLDSSETFLCNVLAGKDKHPQATLKTNRNKYPELYTLLRKNYAAERERPNGNLAFMSGVWLPSGNAKLLGVHPTFGLLAGGRNKHNEVNLTMDFCFGNAANNYSFLRKDSLYFTRHFVGGYIGLDYTYYIIHTTNFELGLSGGAGYDGFDVIEESKYDHSKNYLKPFSIGCLKLNAGLRCNYYFNPHLYIGIGGKFNKLNYKNTGGTNLNGNAVSLDFFIGGS